MHNRLRTDLNQVLKLIAEKLDIGAERHEKATREYKKLADWLNENGTSISSHSPQVYPQGSISLGTAVKPINPDEDFDVDLVCELYSINSEILPSNVKKIVGDRLKENIVYKKNLVEKNRCWRVNFPGDFHMDILPAKPDEDRGRTAILIPDKKLADWSQSDPKGYASWFHERMSAQFNLNKITLAESLNKEVEEIPDYTVKTTLQQSVQLLKRNRDILFNISPDNKPISIIITTLAGSSYKNQNGLLDTLIFLATEMPNHIRRVGGDLWITNPVNSDENFADKWKDHPEKQKAFFDWIRNLKIQLTSLEKTSTMEEAEEILQKLFGEKLSSSSIKEFSSTSSKLNLMTSPFQSKLSHKLPLKWEFLPKYQVQISALKTAGENIKGVMPKPYPNNGNPIAKLYSLEFSATTDAPHPYSVEWQVTNTGEEASRANSLRGGFECSSGTKNNKFFRKESTQYKGSHYIEAFVIKDGVCVARSGDFVVNIQ